MRSELTKHLYFLTSHKRAGAAVFFSQVTRLNLISVVCLNRVFMRVTLCHNDEANGEMKRSFNGVTFSH